VLILASAIVRTLNSAHDTDAVSTSYPTSAFITHLVYLHDTEVAVDVQKITVREVHCGTWRCSDYTYFGTEHGCKMCRGEWRTRETV
jgi:hypothetical protein